MENLIVKRELTFLLSIDYSIQYRSFIECFLRKSVHNRTEPKSISDPFLLKQTEIV